MLVTALLSMILDRYPPALYRAAAITFAVVIAGLSLRMAGPGGGIPHIDKLMHLLAYGALCGAIIRGWPRWPIGVGLGLAVGFGIAIEWAQGAMDLGRTASFADAVANTIGAALAAAILWIVRRHA